MEKHDRDDERTEQTANRTLSNDEIDKYHTSPADEIKEDNEEIVWNFDKPDHELTDEELNELALRARAEALQNRSVLEEKSPKRMSKGFVWIMSIVLALSTFAGLFQVFSIPAIEFLKTSAMLSQNKEIAGYKEAVVVVTTESGKGTGFAITDDGLILTNRHVIEDSDTVSVVFPNDGRFNATVVNTFPAIDLALLSVDGKNLPFLKLSDDPLFEKDDPITFIGNPLAFKGIANKGSLLEPILLKTWTDEVMMMEAPVYRGNSGSPVINADGEVIGVVFATLNHSDHGKVGLFVPITEYYKYSAE